MAYAIQRDEAGGEIELVHGGRMITWTAWPVMFSRKKRSGFRVMNHNCQEMGEIHYG